MPFNRRRWIHTIGTASAGFGSARLLSPVVANWKTDSNKPDSLPMQLYKSLTAEQRERVCLPANHPRRGYVSNWWYIHPDHRIPTTFDKEQQSLIKQIFDSLHSEPYQDAVNQQVLLDQYGDENNAPAAGFFGTPDDKDFEFIFTGHHVTRRCNGHSNRGQGFGGNPIFYGHYPHPLVDMRENFNEAKDHPGNPYWYQGKLFNQFVKTLSAKQQSQGLVSVEPRSEQPGMVIQKKSEPKGLQGTELSEDQKSALIQTMRAMLAMFRQEDVDATISAIESRKLIEKLSISWYPGKYDIGSDQVWDTWQIESSEMVWYYRGFPHIHCYFHLTT